MGGVKRPFIMNLACCILSVALGSPLSSERTTDYNGVLLPTVHTLSVCAIAIPWFFMSPNIYFCPNMSSAP